MKIIQKAAFNPNIKAYILLVVAFFMTISIVGIPLLPIWLFGMGQYIGRRFYESLECRLTENHLEFKKGVLFKIEKTIPLENIQNITFIENPLLKYFDLRILKIETAAQSNPHRSSDMKLIGIMNSLLFKENVLQQRTLLINENRKQRVKKSDNQQTINLLKEIRDILADLKKNNTLT